MPWEVDDIRRAMTLTVYVAAARADCTPEEAALLRLGLTGPLDDYRAGRYNEADIIDVVDQLMPDDWEPTGAWKNQLDALGFTPGSPGK